MRWLLMLAVAAGCDKAADLEPRPAPVPVDAPTLPSACDTVLVFLETGGTWIGAPPDLACFSEHRDTAWLKQELRTLQVRLSGCAPSLEVAAANGVAYEDLLAAAEVGHQIGFSVIDIINPVDLPMKFTMAKQTACRGAISRTSTSPSSRSRLPKPRPGDEVKQLVMIAVSKTEIFVNRELVVAVDQVMNDSNQKPVPELQRAIPAGTEQVVVEADARTDAKVINRVIRSVQAAGITKIGFATQHR